MFYAGFNFSNFNTTDSSKQASVIQSVNLDAASASTITKERVNIMLMGVDERVEDVGRSDTLMVASLDSDQDKVSLLSIPRDTRVQIKRHGYDKINAAYAYGGEALSKTTVESFLGINIDHYIIVNTNSFGKMIDAIGGVDIDVDKRMFYEDPWDDNGGLVIDLKPGLQHMDGKTAITYVRYRDEEGDAGRVRRQQKFMRACFDKLSDPSMMIKLPEIIKEARTAVKTDLSISDMVELAKTLKLADESTEGLKTGIVPGRWAYINGVSYLLPNIERLGEIVTDNLGIESDKIEKHFEKIAYEYESSVPVYLDNLSDEYDENVNKDKDRELIKYLAEEQHFELVENNT
ncbi:MAG: LCP family protein [Selenomonadaceae bacterium]|nr:LCP family protein [Selenomonadaceae bacterium]